MPIHYKNNYLRSGTSEPRFVMPGDELRAAQYGFEKHPHAIDFIDNAVNDLVQTVASKGWDIPGIDVTFNVSGSLSHPVHHLAALSGGDAGHKWQIKFERAGWQSPLEDKRFEMAASHVTIPGYDIILGSGKTAFYHRYTGSNWFDDETDFHHSNTGQKTAQTVYDIASYVSSGENFIYIDRNGHDATAPSGLESAIPEWEVFLNTGRFIDRIAHDIGQKPDISASPYDVWQRIALVERKTVSPHVPTLFTVASNIACKDPDVIVPMAPYPFIANQYRQYFPDDVNAIAARKCHYGFTHLPFRTFSKHWGDDPLSLSHSIYQVDLKYTNDIYVVDEQPFLAAQHYFKAVADDQGRHCLLEDELSEAYSCIAKTATPLSDYTEGQFKKPFYLIARPLWADEATEITRDIRETVPREIYCRFRDEVIQNPSFLTKPFTQPRGQTALAP